MHEAASVERNLLILAQLARRLELPVVVSEQNPAKLGGTISGIAAALGEFEAVEKLRFSAWPDAQNAIEATERKTVVLCGLEAHICVSQTALDLIDNGYAVFAVGDAIAARTQSNFQVGWQRMTRAGVVASSTEAALYELLERAGTDDFRALLALIK